MELVNLWKLVVRQRAIVLVMALLSVVGLYVVYSTSPPVYRSSGSIVLFNPPNAPDDAGFSGTPDPASTTVVPDVASDPATSPITQPGYNPYGAFNDLSVMTDILVRVMNSPPVEAQLQDQGLQGTFVIGANVTFYRGPILDVSAEADAPEQAQSSVNVVLKEVERQVIALQDQRGVNPEYRITTGTVVRPEPGTSVFSGTLRRLIVAAGLCGAATVGLALLADVRRARRATREQAEGPASSVRTGPAGPGSDATVPATPDVGGAEAHRSAVPVTQGPAPSLVEAEIADGVFVATDPAAPPTSAHRGAAGDGVPSSFPRA